MQDNCLLSSQEVSQLVNTNNLQVDNGWDLYARLESGYNCRSSESGEMNYNYWSSPFLIPHSSDLTYLCFRLLQPGEEPVQALLPPGEVQAHGGVPGGLLCPLSQRDLLQHLQLRGATAVLQPGELPPLRHSQDRPLSLQRPRV